MTSISSTDLDALRHRAAYAPLTDHAFLRITGSDATRWLNGMVTNNIKDLKPGEGNYNFLLNAQGRIQADAMIYREPHDGEPTFLLETGNSQLEAIQKHLDRFIIMDDVELREVRSGSRMLLVAGPQAAQALTAVGLPAVPVNTYAVASSSEGPIAIVANGDADRFELLGEEDQIDFLRPKLALPEMSAAALEAHRILSGTPRYGTDITDKDLPQETNQTHALHFSKGCYLGQEIVERIHSRGQVHRIFSKFTLEGAAPTLPAPLTVDGKPAGELTSAISVDGQLHALGYLRREFAQATLLYEGGVATAAPSSR